MKVSHLILFLSLSIAVFASHSATGPRILALFDSLEAANSSYSKFLGDLNERGFAVEIKEVSDSKNKLFMYEERNYDHLILLAASSKTFGGDVNTANLIKFANKGGNILVATSSEIPDLLKDFALEFSADFDDRQTAIFDFFHSISSDSGSPTVYSSSYDVKGTSVVTNPTTVKNLKDIGPVLFSGVSHRLTGRNPLFVPVLTAEKTAFSLDVKNTDKTVIEPTSPFIGKKNILVSAGQTRGNARIAFAGSASMFSNEFYEKNVQVNGESKRSGNQVFTAELSKWVFHEKRVLRIKGAKHHKEGETQSRGIYRIKDKMAHELKISEWCDGKWNPFVAHDIQFQAIMLDPYVRKTMIVARGTPEDASSTKYVVFYKLPDHYGVFTLKIEYKRHGYTWIESSDVVEVRPFRHNEFPRFLSVAYPYYANAFSMMFGLILISSLFLFHKDSKDVKEKTKKQ